jgi:hypothetical protein
MRAIRINMTKHLLGTMLDEKLERGLIQKLNQIHTQGKLWEDEKRRLYVQLGELGYVVFLPDEWGLGGGVIEGKGIRYHPKKRIERDRELSLVCKGILLWVFPDRRSPKDKNF